MSNEFYLRTEIHKNVKNEDVVHKDVLFFKHEKAGFDGKATRDHIKMYPYPFELFKQAHPDYVLPDHLSDVEIGSPKLGEGFGFPKAEAPEVKEVEAL